VNHGHARRTAALALTAAVTVGGALLVASPASAIDKVGGPGCSTNGVTLYVGTGPSSSACYAGSAGTNYSGAYAGSVKGVWNHGYVQYTRPYDRGDDVTGYLANGVKYPFDDRGTDSAVYAITIQN